MKTLFPLLLIAILTLSSCATEEGVQQETTETFLKSYTITRDVQGKYSIDYEIKDNTATDVVKNEATNTNEIHLFSGKVAVENKQSNSLSLENNQLQVGFYENGEKSKSFIVEDENIVLAKGEESEEFLVTYSITDLGDDNYHLDFQVKEGINVWYEYNEEEEAYEVHLKEGTAEEVEFSKTYVKTADVLKINFVNYIKLDSGKGTSAKYSTSNKPKVAWG